MYSQLILRLAKSTAVWLSSYALFRSLAQFVPDKWIKSRRALAHRVYVSGYTYYCIVSALQFKTISNLVSSLYAAPLSKYSELPLTPYQETFFVAISGYEIADGIIRTIDSTFTPMFIFHHALHLIAYTWGGLIWRKYGWGLHVHLLLSEWRDISYVWIKMLRQLNIELKFLHYLDAAFVSAFIPLTWKFAGEVFMKNDIGVVMKAALASYCGILGLWLRDRLKWNWKKIQVAVHQKKK